MHALGEYPDFRIDRALIWNAVFEEPRRARASAFCLKHRRELNSTRAHTSVSTMD